MRSPTNHTPRFAVCPVMPLHHITPHVSLSPLCHQPDTEQIETETSSALLLVQIIPDIQNAKASSGSRSVVSDVSEKSRTWERSKRGHELYAEWRERSTFQMQRMFSTGCFFENMATGSKRIVRGYGIKEPGGENKTTAYRKRGAEDKSFTHSSLLDVESYTTEE